jgi:basic membrane protein A
MTIAEVAAGKFTNTPYLGTMQNNGAGLAPYHDLIRKVPSDLRKEVSKLGNDIRSGKVAVKK